MANPSASSVGNATEQQFLPSASVDGIGDLGNYDKWSGGEVTATITKYRPGGMGPEITYPSLSIIGDITIERVHVVERDQALIAALKQVAGQAKGQITLQPLDQDGNVLGQPTVWQGRLSKVADGATDSQSSAPRTYSLDFAIETQIG
jgi:hypothetical protein